MPDARARVSTRTIVATLIVSLIAIVWGEVLKDALEHSEEYSHSRQAIDANETVDHLLTAGQNLAFERGRTNVVLSLDAPVSPLNRDFILGRRAAAEEGLVAALDHLRDSPLPEVARLRDAMGRVHALRTRVDPAMELPGAERPADLAMRWFPAMSGLLDDIRATASAVSLSGSYSAQFRMYSRVKLLAFDLRVAAGMESSRIATAIAAPGMPMASTTDILRLRGESAAIWRALVHEVGLARDDEVRKALGEVEARFFEALRPLQDRILDAKMAGRPSPVTTADYTKASVPALDSIATLMAITAERTRLAVIEEAAESRFAMLVYGSLAALALVVGLITLYVLQARLLRPLRLVQHQLRSLAKGNTDIDVTPPRRHDEMGEMQAAVAAFRDSVIERQHIAEELARQSERLSTLINAMPDFVCFKDGEGRWLIVNDYGRALFGLQQVDYYGKTDAELSLLSVDCCQSLCGCADTDRRAWDKGAAARGEEVVTGSDGHTYIFDVVKVPLFRPDGGRTGLVVVGSDITERRRIEAALARLSRQNELILEAAGEGIIGVDANGETIFANPAAARMTGWDLGDLLGTKHHRMVHHTRADGSPHPDHECPVARTLTDGQPRYVADDLFWRKDGTCFPVEFTADAMVEQGEVRGAVIVFRDIGDRKRAQAEIDALLADLQRSNADLEQFAYAVSHDLQEPLRMVATYLQLLSRRYHGQLDQDADEFIDFAVDGSKRMSLLINGLLEFARVGTRGKQPEPVDLAMPVRQAMDNLTTAVEESGASVAVETALPTVMGDPAQLTSLFQNLIGNAIKYSRPDIPPVIRVAARPGAGGTWTLTVTDNGVGIPTGDRERSFGVFQRLGARPDASGTGMGLAICKRIVERLGGRIWIEDAEGGGCRFAFTLRAG
ncbi:MAG: PAS domain S-box protein [Pseudomonadota bacterium]